MKDSTIIDLRPVLYFANGFGVGFIRLFNSDYGIRWDSHLRFSCRIGLKRYVKLFGKYFTTLS